MDSQPAHSPRQARSRAKREALVQAAVELWSEEGPSALTHRRIAQRAGVSLSATTYYFSDIEELLGAAGESAAREWVDHARAVANRAAASGMVGRGFVEGAPLILAEAVLPPGSAEAIGSHYERLVAAARQPALAEGFRRMRPELDAALSDLLGALAFADKLDPERLLGMVDGAAVAALSEGKDPRTHVAACIERWTA